MIVPGLWRGSTDQGAEAFEPTGPVGRSGRGGGVLGHAIGGGDFRRGRDDEHFHAGGNGRLDRLVEVGVDDHGLGAGVLEDVARFFGGRVPVHGGGVDAEDAGGCGGFEERKVVAEAKSDDVAGLHADAVEAGGCPRGAQVQVVRTQAAVAADDFTHEASPCSLLSGRPGGPGSVLSS